MRNYRYRAFVSYSHADSRWGNWLHRTLETYRVPRKLVGRSTAEGTVPRRLTPVFRDHEDLAAAANLSDEIETALRESRFLVVICSPAAARSKWVNQEIIRYKAIHGEGRILAAIVDGEPFAADIPGQEDQECFPEALKFRINSNGTPTDERAEPIAADLRPGGDGKKYGRSKIIAGLLAVRLDDVIRREAQRRNIRMGIVAASASVIAACMGFLAYATILARDEARSQRAEAEDLIEFMLSDLRERLEVVGRLDVLDAVGQEAIEYYSKLKVGAHTEDSLGRRARAFHLLGEVDDLRGDLDKARTAFDEAYQSTAELLRRSPDDGERVFEHAQSVFWVGYLNWRLGNYDHAEAAFLDYASLANRLTEIDPANVDWLAELGHANINLGVYTLDTGLPDDAIRYFQRAQKVFEVAAGKDPDSTEWLIMQAQARAWLADAHFDDGSPAKAHSHRMVVAELYRSILIDDPGNQDVNQDLIISHRQLAELAMHQGAVAAAISDLLIAKQYGEELLAIDPDNTMTMQMVASVLTDLAEAHGYEGSEDSAIKLLDQSDDIVSELLEENPEVLEWKLQWYENRLQLSQLFLESGQQRQVIAQLSNTIKEIDQLSNDNPDVKSIRHLLARAHFNLASAYRYTESEVEASEQTAEVISELSGMEGELPPRMIALLGLSYRTVGNVAKANDLALQLEAINFRHPGYLMAESSPSF